MWSCLYFLSSFPPTVTTSSCPLSVRSMCLLCVTYLAGRYNCLCEAVIVCVQFSKQTAGAHRVTEVIKLWLILPLRELMMSSTIVYNGQKTKHNKKYRGNSFLVAFFQRFSFR